MTDIKYHYDIVQGTEAWLRLKHGVLSASTFKNVITPAKLQLSTASNTRLFYDEILSQRIDKTLQPNYVSYDMQRGHIEEVYAVQQYQKEYNDDVKTCGFIINTSLGFPLGYSPDALIGDDGLIEAKSRIPKIQVKTILDHICGRTDDIIPSENMMQVQSGLFISDRKYCEFISFCNGNQMATITVEPLPQYQDAIRTAAIAFEKVLVENMEKYEQAVANDPRLTLTPRRAIEEDIVV